VQILHRNAPKGGKSLRSAGALLGSFDGEYFLHRAVLQAFHVTIRHAGRRHKNDFDKIRTNCSGLSDNMVEVEQ
jgi:hypothetical protein